jgi:hypothetical protein
MSAPLVVNTRDGVCWTRRTVTSGGIALYAPESVKTCPDFVMATEAELAEHGIVGSADALPMPVGPEADDRAKAPWGRGEDGRPLLPTGAHWTDVPEAVDRRVAKIQARVDEAQPGPWYRAPATEPGVAPGTVRTRVDGYPRMVGQFTNVSPADLEMVLYAGSDLRWCLEMIAKFRTRVAELEAQAAQVAPLREAALHDLPPGTQWRVITTDSESLTGLAPVCTADRRFHEIPDYPGGPKYDDEGVYDCCPWPQIETYSVDVAAYLVALLNADAAKGGDAR